MFLKGLKENLFFFVLKSKFLIFMFDIFRLNYAERVKKIRKHCKGYLQYLC